MSPAVRRDPLQQVGAPLRLFNLVAGRLPRLDRPLPRIEEAVAEAARDDAVGVLPDDDGLRDGLVAFLSALEAEADLTPAGRRFARGVVLSTLSNQARVRQAVADDPAIARRPVGPAIVVSGLPRTGTTLLQHLLSLDPDTRSLRHWEAAQPAPPPGADPVADRERIRAAERAIRLVDRLLPHARRLHPTGAELPTECVSLFATSFASLELGVLYRIPSYVRWCLQADLRPHYSFYARQLQVLGRHGSRAQWVLKSPAHLFWLDELTEALPESRIVLLHRDPLEVLGSFCRLAAVAVGATTRSVDRYALGALWSEVWAEGLRRTTAARARIGADRCIDVGYADLVADPVGTVAGIYEAFGLPFTDRLARAVRDHVATHPQQHPSTAPRLEDFGLDPAVERRRFDEAAGAVRTGDGR